MNTSQKLQRILLIGASLLLGAATLFAACPLCQNQTLYNVGLCLYTCPDVPGCWGGPRLTECKTDPFHVVQVLCISADGSCDPQIREYYQCYQDIYSICGG